jgi:acyl dehydratase
MSVVATPAALFPRTMSVHVQLDDDPRYKGSMHDDEVARAAGYKAALVPGAFVYGHMSRFAIDAWGVRWAETGAMSARFRRPVYNGDDLTLEASALSNDRADVSVRNADGEEVAIGWIALPRGAPEAPEISSLAVLPMPGSSPAVVPGGLVAGTPIHSGERELTMAEFERSLAAFGEWHPIYDDRSFAHAGWLMRLAMGDTNGSFRFPSPVVLTEAEAQHYALVRPGQKVTTSGSVSEVFERKGKHYFVSEEFMIADKATVVARFRRTSIYASS